MDLHDSSAISGGAVPPRGALRAGRVSSSGSVTVAGASMYNDPINALYVENTLNAPKLTVEGTIFLKVKDSAVIDGGAVPTRGPLRIGHTESSGSALVSVPSMSNDPLEGLCVEGTENAGFQTNRDTFLLDRSISTAISGGPDSVESPLRGPCKGSSYFSSLAGASRPPSPRKGIPTVHAKSTDVRIESASAATGETLPM